MSKLRIRVYHSLRGCETGCCGHRIEVEGKDCEPFDFDHAPKNSTDDEKKQWAVEFAQMSVKDKWPDCYDSIDWDSIQIDEVQDDRYC